jgi:membrane protein
MFSFAIFFLSSTKDISSIFLGLCAGNVVAFIIAILYVGRNLNVAFDFRHIGKALLNKIFFLDGKMIFLNSLLLISVLQIDALLIAYLYGEEILAKYMIIYKIPNTLIMLGWRLSEPFGVVISKQIKQDKNLALLNFLIVEKKILAAGIIATLGYFFLGHFVLGLWLGDNIYEVKYMYVASSALILLSITQRLYFMTNYYIVGINVLNLLLIIELLCKVLFIMLFFDYFKEVSPILGWTLGLLITMYFYRKNTQRIFASVKS